MNDITLSETVDAQQNNLTTRFIATGVISTILIVVGMSMRGYYVLRSSGVENETNRVGVKVSEVVDILLDETKRVERRHLIEIGDSFKYLNGVTNVTIFNVDLNPVWPSKTVDKLSSEERIVVQALLADNSKDASVIDLSFALLSTWVDGLIGKSETLPVFVKLKDSSGKVFSVTRLDYNFEGSLNYARHFGFRVFLFAFLCSVILFLSLYYTFRRGIKTIERQEDRLTQQITRLSNLLATNKDMQKSMKTASSRAVELNEQFLRRVGADLHDGPAQMIGFAVLRLNQVSKQEAAKMFGHEFHAVREALDESLEEIRGISSGLVLPELEAMSLEECLRKVVTLHGAKSKVPVEQYYQELPKNIPLPIKICAYRFIQEGLNNAHRHGSAKKCRLSAYVKDKDLVISLKDNGVGFRKSKLLEGGTHLGLVGLKDRVESLGGVFSINSELGTGTALKVVINLADEH